MGTQVKIMEIGEAPSRELKIELPFDPKKKIFTTSKEISRNILQYFKEKKLLPYVLPELFPEKFTSKIIINRHNQKNETAYIVRFHLDLKSSEDMEDSVAKYNNRSIDRSSDNTLKFMVEIPRNSRIVKENKEKIVLSFN
jgi:hypothetical protein